MADKRLDYSGLSRYDTKIKEYITTAKEQAMSITSGGRSNIGTPTETGYMRIKDGDHTGTEQINLMYNLATSDNTLSLMFETSGDWEHDKEFIIPTTDYVDNSGEVFKIIKDTTTYQEVLDAFNDKKGLLFCNSAVVDATSNPVIYSLKQTDHILLYVHNHPQIIDVWKVNTDNTYEKTREFVLAENQAIKDYVDTKTAQATDSTLGTVKLNPAESVDVNAQGQLTVGGRLGQFPNGGVFYPTTIAPTNVGTSSFLMTDGAKNLSLSQRSFAIMAGAGITCKSAVAGTTEYRITNSQSNRFALAAVRNGMAALNQTDAQQNGTAKIISIKFANGNDLTEPYFGPNENSNDIIITLDRTINPDSSTTSIRVYGTNTSSDNILVGQGVGAGGGKVISLGQSTYAKGNQNVSIGNSTHVTANNSVALGHTHLVNKQFCFAAGQGHDFTNGGNGASAVGIASEITSNTAFAVGNGAFNSNGSITRSNALEVLKDGSIVLKSPNGTKYKISVDDSGNLTTTAI